MRRESPHRPADSAEARDLPVAVVQQPRRNRNNHVRRKVFGPFVEQGFDVDGVSDRAPEPNEPPSPEADDVAFAVGKPRILLRTYRSAVIVCRIFQARPRG